VVPPNFYHILSFCSSRGVSQTKYCESKSIRTLPNFSVGYATGPVLKSRSRFKKRITKRKIISVIHWANARNEQGHASKPHNPYSSVRLVRCANELLRRCRSLLELRLRYRSEDHVRSRLPKDLMELCAL